MRLPGRNIILCRAREKGEKYGDRPERIQLSLQRRRKSDQGDKISAGAEKGQAIADYAQLFEGKHYKNGGTSLTEGADSSGFTQSVLAHFGIAVPRLSAGQLTGTSLYGGTYATPKKISVSELQPGDLVFYGNPVNHAAIYLGNGTIIHAFNEERGIIRTAYDYRTITAARGTGKRISEKAIQTEDSVL